MTAPDCVNPVYFFTAQSKLSFENFPKKAAIKVLVEVADNNEAVAWGGVRFDQGLYILNMAVRVPPQMVPMLVDEKKCLSRLLVEQPSIGERTVTSTSSRAKTSTSVAKEIEAFRIVQRAKRSVDREQF